MHMKLAGLVQSLPTDARKLHVLVCPGSSPAPLISPQGANDKVSYPDPTAARYKLVMAAFGKVELTGLTLVLKNTGVTTAVAKVAVVEENTVVQQEQTIEMPKEGTKTLFYKLGPLLERKRIIGRPTAITEMLDWPGANMDDSDQPIAPVVTVTGTGTFSVFPTWYATLHLH
jgi:hypothetical protein